MDNEDIILVAKLADASLELAAKYETGDENETEQAATAWQQTCQEIVSNIGRSPQLQQLKNTFQLSNEALTAICLILLPQINSKYCDFYNDFTGGKSNAPTLDLASTIACATYSQKSKLLAELDIESPIFYWNYLVVKTTDSFTSDALSASPFFIDYMLGSAANLLGDLLTFCTASPINLTADEALLPIDNPLQIISGGFAERQLTLAIRFAGNYYQRPLYRLNPPVLSSETSPINALKSALGLITLYKGMLYWQNALENLNKEPGLIAIINAWLDNSKNILFAGEETVFTLPASIDPFKTGTIRLQELKRSEEKEVWAGMGQALLGNNNIDWGCINNAYTLNMDRIGQTLLRLRQTTSAGGNITTAMLQECYVHSSADALGGLAYLDNSPSSFEQMVLNANTKSQLDAIQKTFRNRTVLNNFTQLGIVTIFTGQSGNGKTMAAESLANALQLPLYRLDYSQIENSTEASIARLFDEAEINSAALLFDEADALFVNKSDSTGSGNLITAFLIQKIESYGGLAILATNDDKKIDPAFFRRAINIVNFPLLNASERYTLFQKLFIEKNAKPGAGLDLASVSGNITMSGRGVNNIFNAAFINAVDENPDASPVVISKDNFTNAIKQETK